MNINDFDKIWCLHCVEHNNRYIMSQNEFKKVNILDKVEYRWTSLQIPINIRKCLSQLKTESEYHCTREHYTMINIAYQLGYNHILIFEDDVKFIKKNYFDLFMNDIPDDFDILRLGGAIEHVYENGPKLFDNRIYWTKLDFRLWSTIGYALSRKGMKYYLDYIKSNYHVADMPLYDMNAIRNNGINCYISTLPICYYHKFDSSIQPVNDFEYKDEFYKNIDLTLYN